MVCRSDAVLIQVIDCIEYRKCIVKLCPFCCNSEKRFWFHDFIFVQIVLTELTHTHVYTMFCFPFTSPLNMHLFPPVLFFVSFSAPHPPRALRWGPSWVSTSPAYRIFWGSSCFCDLPGLSALPASWSPWLLSACAVLV